MGAPLSKEGGHPRSPAYRVGDRVLHRAFGEGLIVEVRERDGFEVLEIAFADGIRRLTSLYPLEPARGGGRGAAAATAPAPIGRMYVAHIWSGVIAAMGIVPG